MECIGNLLGTSPTDHSTLADRDVDRQARCHFRFIFHWDPLLWTSDVIVYAVLKTVYGLQC